MNIVVVKQTERGGETLLGVWDDAGVSDMMTRLFEDYSPCEDGTSDQIHQVAPWFGSDLVAAITVLGGHDRTTGEHVVLMTYVID